jgi:hypothetical protein
MPFCSTPPGSTGSTRTSGASRRGCPSRHVSLERGLEFLELQAKSGVERIAHLGPYMAEIAKQDNRGTWDN